MTGIHERGIEAAAHAITGFINGVCCHRTGGSGKDASCECQQIARAAISAYLSAVAPQSGDNAEEPKRWLLEEHIPGGSTRWHCFEHEQQCRARGIISQYETTVTPLYTHPCTSTPVVSQNAPDLEDKPCGISDPSTRDCPNMKEVGGGMDGERYRCAVCGKGYYLDYEEMK
ncbi:hypothetical protein [Rhizobium phage RHEph18]|uniref:hypothetical protein n=1 Tax=Rhizobium sp. N871 TaxID=1703968 RepID=UPI0007EC0C12|nr:hypothetical protein [Rhizobium sp. N871]ANL02640.1 hypothetical protein AMJ99_CH01053 [Rhizobium esperanzae]ANM33492.1 hypothetical protein AMK04_CH01054 [Rhizobium sp. N871]QIG73723.1 hypothetical protein EVC05_031 [Rhizobium phage RHph_N2]QXV74441.1 hypothetical protein [Rhizobium phage RHEph18]